MSAPPAGDAAAGDPLEQTTSGSDTPGSAAAGGVGAASGRWVEVRVLVAPADSEPVAAALGELAGSGASIEEGPPSGDDPAGAPGGGDGSRALVRVWIPVPPGADAGWEREARDAVAATLARLTLAEPCSPETALVEPPDWAREWRRFYRPLRIGRRLVICPPWERPVLARGEVSVVIDPGRAFGTGHHESTRLCLGALESQLVPGWDVIDLGTGSGILAVAAARLGAASVRALDIDPEAVGVARESMARNGVSGRVVAAVGSLGPAWPWPASAGRPADLVLANLSEPLLRDLVWEIARVVRPGGLLIAAGYLDRDEPAVEAALASAGLRTLRVVAEGEWRCHVAVVEPPARSG